MSFEKSLDTEMRKPGFGTANCHLFFKERPHISKSMADAANSSMYIDTGGSSRLRYSSTSARYICAADVTYDLLVSVYDVDTNDMFAMRIFKYDAETFKPLEKYLSEIGRNKYKKFEARLIGLQDKQDYGILTPLFKALGKYKVPVMEVDLFGNQTRHIALDSYLGMSFNMLLQDRIYRPGELNTQITQEQFEARLMEKAKAIEPVKSAKK